MPSTPVSSASAPGGFRRALGGFTVIVFGVLVALGAESWWSEREDRRFERELREDIAAEFAANLEILESDLAENDTSHTRLSSLDELNDAELLALSSQELTSRLGDGSLSWAGFDPEMGIVQALVESGNIGVISDRDLRLHLSVWAGLLVEKRRFNLQAVDFQYQIVIPALARATADLVWTEAERREAQTLLRTLSDLHTNVIQNQQRLQVVALDIQAYVEGQR